MKKHNDQKISDVLREMAGQRQFRGKLKLTKIKSSWEKLMGPKINSYTSKITLRDRTVYIELTSAPLKQELSMSKAQILERLNEELGEEFLREVVIR